MSDMLSHQKNAEAHDQIRRRDADIGVDQSERFHRQEKRDHICLKWEHRGCQDHEKKNVPPGKDVLAKDKAGQKRGRHYGHSCPGRYNDTIDEVATDGCCPECCGIVCERPMDREQSRWPQQRFIRGLEGSRQHPNGRKEHHQAPGKKKTVADCRNSKTLPYGTAPTRLASAHRLHSTLGRITRN